MKLILQNADLMELVVDSNILPKSAEKLVKRNGNNIKDWNREDKNQLVSMVNTALNDINNAERGIKDMKSAIVPLKSGTIIVPSYSLSATNKFLSETGDDIKYIKGVLTKLKAAL